MIPLIIFYIYIIYKFLLYLFSSVLLLSFIFNRSESDSSGLCGSAADLSPGAGPGQRGLDARRPRRPDQRPAALRPNGAAGGRRHLRGRLRRAGAGAQGGDPGEVPQHRRLKASKDIEIEGIQRTLALKRL